MQNLIIYQYKKVPIDYLIQLKNYTQFTKIFPFSFLQQQNTNATSISIKATKSPQKLLIDGYRRKEKCQMCATLMNTN